MRSATPKVLHRLCGRPMLDYVLDAWESTADGAAAGHPVIVYSPAVDAIVDVFADRGTFALQDTPRGTGDAVRVALTSIPAQVTEILVLSGDVPLVTGADLDAVLESASPGRCRHRARERLRGRPGAARSDRAWRVRDGREDRRGERRDGRRTRRQRGQRRALRLRCRLAASPDRRAGAVGCDRRAVPHRPRRPRSRGRPASQRGRLRR